MSEHDIAAKCAGQVADLQARLGIGVESRQRINICGTNYVVDTGVADYLSGMADEVERLRNGLRAVKVIVAGLSMTDANFGRAELARLENYIENVLAGTA